MGYMCRFKNKDHIFICCVFQAEEFHSTVHILLEWLAEAEQSLRFHGSLPEDEEALRGLIEQHKASLFCSTRPTYT